METKLILYGASGHGKVVADIAISRGEEVAFFLDDNPAVTSLGDPKVVHTSTYQIQEQDSIVLSIGNNAIRKKLAQKLKACFKTLMHPKAHLSKTATLGEGTVVMAGVLINPDARIGNHVILNTGCIIEHDNTIEDFAHISPGAHLAGNVTVKEGAHVGIGASVIQGITIGKWATIGAGTVIIHDVPDYAVVVGNPGRIIRYNGSRE
jgi:sugar O-acyltransferase (sialic acid O-acetyltransferase NeuD family)